MSNGQTFRNGIDGLHSHGYNWGERLTVVRQDTGYGVTRYIVKDNKGSHGYAY